MSSIAYQEGRKQRYASYVEGKNSKADEDSKRGRLGGVHFILLMSHIF